MNVTFKNISLAYDKKEILHNLNFTIPEGTLVSILGPSGGGKSTTLMLIAGLLAPTAGQIFFGEEEVTKKDALARKVGMVFQNYALYPHLTVRDNIAFPLKMAKVPKRKRQEKAQELAKLVHIDDQLDKKPGELSGGQQQRVAIARALAKSPSILLLDEPLSNLDARLRFEMREEIRRIQIETGVTTIFVTHDQDEALHISDQIMVLNDGDVQQFSEPNELYETPSNSFVSRFIGNPIINSLPIEALKPILTDIVPADILNRTATAGIRSESILFNETPDMLTKGTAKIVNQAQFGREATTILTFNHVSLTSTNAAPPAMADQKLPIFLTKRGFFLFDAAGVLIYGGDLNA